MRPNDIKRELERLTVDCATARTQLVDLRGRLREASNIVSELKKLVATMTPPRLGDTTPARRPTQDSVPSSK
jgi:hypothetical protein